MLKSIYERVYCTNEVLEILVKNGLKPTYYADPERTFFIRGTSSDEVEIHIMGPYEGFGIMSNEDINKAYHHLVDRDREMHQKYYHVYGAAMNVVSAVSVKESWDVIFKIGRNLSIRLSKATNITFWYV